MFQKIIKNSILVLVLSLLLPISVAASADITPIINLTEDADSYDQKTILIEAEAIGESMIRKDNAWINVLDSSGSIGVWVTKEDALRITHYGNHNMHGDLLQISGIYHNSCTEHGGEADIHCLDLKILEQGYPQKDTLSFQKLAITVLLIIAALLCAYRFFSKTTIPHS